MNHFPPEILQMSVLIDGILNKVEVILINEKLICFHLITVFNSFSFCEKKSKLKFGFFTLSQDKILCTHANAKYSDIYSESHCTQ